MPWPISSGKGPTPGQVLLPNGAEAAMIETTWEQALVRPLPQDVQSAVSFMLTMLPPPVPGDLAAVEAQVWAYALARHTSPKHFRERHIGLFDGGIGTKWGWFGDWTGWGG